MKRLEVVYFGDRCSPDCDHFQSSTERGSELRCGLYEQKLRADTWSGKCGPKRLNACKRGPNERVDNTRNNTIRVN